MQGPLASNPERGGSKQGAHSFPRYDAAGKHDQAARRNAGRQCSACRPQAVHKGISASIQGRHLAAEEVHRLRKGKGRGLAVCPVGAVYQFLVHGKMRLFEAPGSLSARRVTSLAIRLRAASGDVQMDVQLYTEMYNNLYTPNVNETAGNTAEQAEKGDVQNMSRP